MLHFDLAEHLKNLGVPQEWQPPFSIYFYQQKNNVIILPVPQAYLELKKQIGTLLVRMPQLAELFYIMRGCDLTIKEEGDIGSYGGTCKMHGGQTLATVTHCMNPDEVLALMYIEAKKKPPALPLGTKAQTLIITGTMKPESQIIKP